MIRDMLAPQRQPQEEWIDWHTRTLGNARAIINRYTTPWPDQLAKQKANWAAVLATKPTMDAVRRTVLWRCAAWRTQDAEEMGWRRLRRTTTAKWIRWEGSLV